MCPCKAIFSLFFLMLNPRRNWISFSFFLGLAENLLTVRVLQTGYKCMLGCWSDSRNLAPNAETFLERTWKKFILKVLSKILRPFFRP